MKKKSAKKKKKNENPSEKAKAEVPADNPNPEKYSDEETGVPFTGNELDFHMRHAHIRNDQGEGEE